jgi:uncharacterized protein (TIGR02996 family)
MKERDLLMQAILDHPDEDAPRLVFADWLEEHGESELGRYVRLRCEFGDENREDPRFAAVQDEFYRLDYTVGAEWADEWKHNLPPEAASALRIVEAGRRRGLYRYAVIVPSAVPPIGPFRIAWERLLTRTPIRQINVGFVSSALIRFLASTPTLLRLQNLELYGDDQNGGFATVNSVVQLAQSPYLANLRRLKLYALLPRRRRPRDGDPNAIAAALADSPSLTNIEQLDVPMGSGAVRQRLIDRFGQRLQRTSWSPGP